MQAALNREKFKNAEIGKPVVIQERKTHKDHNRNRAQYEMQYVLRVAHNINPDKTKQNATRKCPNSKMRDVK